jgi:hypothetical protein
VEGFQISNLKFHMKGKAKAKSKKQKAETHPSVSLRVKRTLRGVGEDTEEEKAGERAPPLGSARDLRQ